MPARSAVILRLLLAALVAVVTSVGISPAVARKPTASVEQPVLLAAMLDTLEREPDPQLRLNTFYRMRYAFDRGTVRFAGPAAADRFAQVMSRLMRLDTASTLAWQATELMVRFPHPAATEALLEVARREGIRSSSARSSALEALVALREPRVLPLLQAELNRARTNRRLALRLIAELGDARGLAILQGFKGDSNLRDRLIQDLRTARVAEDGIEKLATENAAGLRAAAARAERDLKRALEDGIVSAFDLDDETFRKLARQGFAICDEGGHELYEFLTTAYPCVTSDVAFHAFVLVVRGALGEVDSLVIEPRLLEFCMGMQEACARIAAREPAGPVRDAAWRGAAFFAVPATLMGGSLSVAHPPALAQAVAADLALIRGHDAPGYSAVLGKEEDFTKYTPRGRLSTAPNLVGYFQAAAWLGRGHLSYRDHDDLRRALVMTAAVRSDTALARRWRRLDLLLRGFYGPLDDQTFDDLARAVSELRPRDGLLAVAADSVALEGLSASLASAPSPGINTGFASSWAAWPQRHDMIGLRVLGQRYSRSADLFQRLLEHGVWPPSGLDVAASLMGSAHAARLARPSGTPVGRPSGVAAPAALPLGTGGLPEGALTTLATLFQRDRRQPGFMHQPAWEEKQINTALAGWSEVQNLTAPFMKDANVYMGGSAMADRFHGWVEPVPKFYARLDSMTRDLAARLDRVGAFAAIDSSRARALAAHPEPPTGPDGSRAQWTITDFEANRARATAGVRVSRAAFDDLSYILRRLADLSERALRGEGQTIDDGVFLKSLRFRFKTLAFNISNSDRAIEPMAVIADPVTEYQTARCLEVGTGRPRAIYVAVPDGNRTFVCRGGVYSYHEFTRPIEQRLDDPTWRRMVDTSDAPPAWMESRPAIEATGRARPPDRR